MKTVAVKVKVIFCMIVVTRAVFTQSMMQHDVCCM